MFFPGEAFLLFFAIFKDKKIWHLKAQKKL